MNEHDQSVPPPITAIKPDPMATPAQKPLRYWLKKLFACNPFYLVSAMLLLYGCYRVLIDAPFLDLELSRLWFSYSSVQLYELLLATTAIFLARRKLTYDSNLLFSVENLLVFVPFILISQAAFIDLPMARAMSLAAAGLAVIRFRALKRCVLDLPGRLLCAGFILLILNVALPLLYRHFGNTKIGIHLDSGPAYVMNEATWLLILPATLALANFLPWAGRVKNACLPNRWLSLGLFSLWFTATGVHVYCLDYIYQFDLRPELFAPGALILAWTFLLYLPVDSAVWVKQLRHALTILPVLVPLLAVQGVHHTYLILAALNIAACIIVCVAEAGHSFARHLLFASVLMLIGGLPLPWVQLVIPGVSIAGCLAGGVIVYLLLHIVLSRNPKLGVFGGFLLGWTLTILLAHRHDGVYWALQGAFVFILLHSLRWDDAGHKGTKLVRAAMSVFWVIDTLAWMSIGPGSFWMPCIPGALVLAVYAVVQFYSGKWHHPGIPAAAILVMVSGPGVIAANNILTMPAGLLAVIGSFLLFGLGTAAALTRSHWHKPEPALPTGSAKMESGNPPTPPTTISLH